MRALRTGIHPLAWSRAKRTTACLAFCLSGVPHKAITQTPTSVVLPVSESPCTQGLFTRVNLSGPAPTGGLVIQLTSSIPAAVAVPATITAAAGTNVATFTLTCTPSTQALAVTITATASGASQSALLNVLAPVLDHVTCKFVLGTTNQDCAAVLIGNAPTGGVIVTLTSSAPNLVAVPPSIVVPATLNNAHFAINNLPPVSQPTNVMITGTGLGVAKTYTLTLMPATPTKITFAIANHFVETTASIVSGNRRTAMVTVSGLPGAGGLPVQLSSSLPAIASVPASVTVPVMQDSALFVISTAAIAQTTPVTITATVGAVSKSVIVTVTGTTLASLSLGRGMVVGGQTGSGSLFPDAPPGAGGLTVQLTSSDPTLALVPPTVTIPAGASVGTFNVATFPVEVSRSVTLTATQGGSSMTATLTLAPEGPTAFTIAPAHVRGGVSAIGKLQALATDDAFVVQLSTTDTAFASMPPSVSFAAGETIKTFTIVTKPVAATQSVHLIAKTVNNIAKSSTPTSLAQPSIASATVMLFSSVTLDPPIITAFTLSPTSVVGGPNTTVTGTLSLDGPAPAGFIIDASSNNPTALHAISSVSFPNGSSTGTFRLITGQVPIDTVVTITVSTRVGSSKSASMTIRR